MKKHHLSSANHELLKNGVNDFYLTFLKGEVHVLFKSCQLIRGGLFWVDFVVLAVGVIRSQFIHTVTGFLSSVTSIFN